MFFLTLFHDKDLEYIHVLFQNTATGIYKSKKMVIDDNFKIPSYSKHNHSVNFEAKLKILNIV